MLHILGVGCSQLQGGSHAIARPLPRQESRDSDGLACIVSGSALRLFQKKSRVEGTQDGAAHALDAPAAGTPGAPAADALVFCVAAMIWVSSFVKCLCLLRPLSSPGRGTTV